MSRAIGALAGLSAFVALASAAWLAPRATPRADEAGWTLAEPVLLPEERTQGNARWREVSCAQCHEEIAREWGATLHALAWEDEVFQDELASIRRKKSCHGCHAPLPLVGTDLAQRPEERPMWRHFGVDCRACHLDAEGRVHGPWGAPSPGHTSVQDDAYAGAGSNALCISCHRVSIGPVLGIAQDFVDEQLGARGLSCVGCHMAPVERSMAVDDRTGEPLPARAGRSHALQTPRDPSFLAQAFALATERTATGALLRVTNRAGHRVPGIEDRRLVFEVTALDAAGKALATGELVVSRREYLAWGESRELALEAKGVTDLRVRATHDAPAYARPVVFLERELELAE
ncbi:MAG: hypothetical protein H6828_01055 [Planctomycetes bacterium]|nr:hypothetical protein [Planctomycetota bacterium]